MLHGNICWYVEVFGSHLPHAIFLCSRQNALRLAMIASLAMVKLSNPVMNLREGIGHGRLYAHVCFWIPLAVQAQCLNAWRIPRQLSHGQGSVMFTCGRWLIQYTHTCFSINLFNPILFHYPFVVLAKSQCWNSEYGFVWGWIPHFETIHISSCRGITKSSMK